MPEDTDRRPLAAVCGESAQRRPPPLSLGKKPPHASRKLRRRMIPSIPRPPARLRRSAQPEARLEARRNRHRVPFAAGAPALEAMPAAASRRARACAARDRSPCSAQLQADDDVLLGGAAGAAARCSRGGRRPSRRDVRTGGERARTRAAQDRGERHPGRMELRASTRSPSRPRGCASCCSRSPPTSASCSSGSRCSSCACAA